MLVIWYCYSMPISHLCKQKTQPTPCPCFTGKKRWEQPRGSWELLVYVVTCQVVEVALSRGLLCDPGQCLFANSEFESPHLYGGFDQSGQVYATMQVAIYTQSFFSGLNLSYIGAAVTLCSGHSHAAGWHTQPEEGTASLLDIVLAL